MKKEPTIFYGMHPSPFGEYLLASMYGKVIALHFFENGGMNKALLQVRKDWPQREILRNQKHTEVFAKKIFAATKKSTSIPFILSGTDFQIAVWDALARIPEGETRTYGEVAKAIGAPKATRAVGSACGKNTIAYLVPCHRVLPKNGSVGPYRWGTTRKKALLAWESSRA